MDNNNNHDEKLREIVGKVEREEMLTMDEFNTVLQYNAKKLEEAYMSGNRSYLGGYDD